MRQEQEITNKGRRSALRGFVGAGAAVVALVALSGCHTDMWRQPYIKPYYQSEFFPDQQASRPLVAGTIPQGELKTSDPDFYRGKGAEGKLIKTIPVRAVQSFASPKAMLLRGQDRYNAYCTPCHGKTGNGNGFITQRGLGYWQKLPASYHTDRLRKTEDGHIYDTITNGYGIMYGYAARIQDPNDRWAVVAYVRALQLMYEGSAPAASIAMPTPEPAGATPTEIRPTGATPTTGMTPTRMPGPPSGRPGLSVPGADGVPAQSDAAPPATEGPGRPALSPNTPPSPGGAVRPPSLGTQSGGAR